MGLNPLEQLNLITMTAIAAIFLVTFFALRKVFFTPLVNVMEKRVRKVERARARYQEADALLGKAREEAARIAAEASETAAHLSEEAKGESAGIRESKCAQANAEAEKVFTVGREEIARLKETDKARLKEYLLTFSKQTLIKIIHEVDEDSLRFVVNRVLTAKETAK